MAVSSTNGISFSGLSSGLDTDSIISQLVNIEKAPIQRMTAQQKTLRDRAELYSQFATKITGIRNTLGIDIVRVNNRIPTNSMNSSMNMLAMKNDTYIE
jgi:flagellar hook-associated protein 2